MLLALAPNAGAQGKDPAQLQVAILAFAEERSLFHQHPVIVRFTNRTNKTLKILRPLDGSEWSWHMPYYRFTILDGTGQALKLSSRCGVSGLWSGIKWPDDYVIQIRAGDSYEMQVGIPHIVPSEGDYKVSFEYVFDSKEKSSRKTGITYPDGLWEGRASSKEVKLRLRASN